MATLGDIAAIGHILRRAYALYEGCRSAPEEIFLAREHVHAVALCLEGVSSDLYSNPRSFVHQSTTIAQARKHALKVHISSCDRALKRMEGLLKTYMGFKGKHVSLWDKFRWSTSGKKEIADCKAELVMSTVVLDMFLSKENLNVLWKLESMIETLTKRIGMLEVFDRPASTNEQRGKRPRRSSNITRAIVVSLVLARLRKALRIYRRKKNGGKRNNTPKPGPRRPKPVSRTSSGFVNNPKRNLLMQSYTANLVTAVPKTPPPPYTAQKPRPRTPSPDFYYIPGGTSTPPRSKPVRRSSSMSRLTNQINTRTITPAAPREHFECWRVGIGSLAFGAKIAPQFLPHRRGQAQLRKMAEVFKEAGLYDERTVTEKHKCVRLLLNAKNKKVAKGKTWYFAGGKMVGRDPGKTGMVSVEKVLVVLVRR